MFSRILLVLDEPDDLDRLLPHLRRLIRRGATRVVVLKTVPFLETIVEMPGELSPELEGDDETAEVYVAALVETLNAEGLSAEGFTLIGRSGLSIAAAAERVGASLIAVALRPRPGLTEAVVGNRIESLIHASPVPVYVVPPAAPARAGPILVPVDESDRSLEAIPTALFLARAFQTEIVFVHVLLDTGETTALFKAREVLRHEGLEAELLIRQGDPATEVARACRELRAGSVVMRSRGLPEGVTRRLLRLAPVPVFVVRRAPAPIRPEEEPLRAPIPINLWGRRTPANPLLGAGDMGE